MVAAGKVGAADRALEQDVADLGETGLAVEEDDVAGRVARAVDHLPRRLAQRQHVAVVQPAGRGEGAGLGQAVFLALGGNQVDPELVLDVGAADVEAGLLLHLGRSARMVQVAVRDPDGVQRQSAPRDLAQDGVDRTARIDDGRSLRPRAPDGGAVLLKRRHGRDEDADGGA
ncbi:hypothetical protein D3C80_1015640 [compost metagenome]